MKKKLKKNWKALTLGSIISLLFLTAPWLCDQLGNTFLFSEYLHLDSPKLAIDLRKKMIFPLSNYLSYNQLTFAAIPWFFFLAFTFAFIYRRSWRLHRPILYMVLGIYAFLYIFPDFLLRLDDQQPSISHGHVANGELSAGKRVNFRGNNFTTYSFPGYLCGRTYAHNEVRNTILAAYQLCEEYTPETNYVLGEIGFKNGGKFLPHRTHQSGMSVDFMTPYKKYDKPFYRKNIFNLWGYRLEFDDEGNTDKYQIDFEAMAQHLYALKKSAQKNGLIIQKVIFDPVLQKKLRHTSVWHKIRQLPFTKRRVVWRHDDHYHVDFAPKRKAKLN